jgi:hypothetical protein
VPVPDRDKPAPKNAPKPISRRAQYKKDGITPLMPPVGAASYIAEYLWEIGPTQASGLGDGVISHQEIAAWQSNLGIELHAWEVGLLRRLSQDYLTQSREAEDPYCKPPFGQLYRNPNLSKLIDAALD